MFLHQNIWLPDGEKHFPEWMSRNGELVGGKGTYQIRKYREAMKWVRNWRCAVDVGAHVGLWSMHLAQRFGLLHAFEPVAKFRECFGRNLAPVASEIPPHSITLHECALGAESALVEMMIDPADTGGTHIVGGTRGTIPMRPLDSIHMGARVDFIKIDCEGYELEVLKGAVQTLTDCRPALIVEQKPHKLAANYGAKGRPAVEFLLGLNLGYVLRREMGGDFILSVDA